MLPLSSRKRAHCSRTSSRIMLQDARHRLRQLRARLGWKGRSSSFARGVSAPSTHEESTSSEGSSSDAQDGRGTQECWFFRCNCLFMFWVHWGTVSGIKRQVLRESFRLHKTVDSNRHTSQEFSCSAEQRGDGEVMTATTGDVHTEVEPIWNDYKEEPYDISTTPPGATDCGGRPTARSTSACFFFFFFFFFFHPSCCVFGFCCSIIGHAMV